MIRADFLHFTSKNVEHSRYLLVIPMQDVHIMYPFEQMQQRAERYEYMFAENETVTIVDWGCSYKQVQGYIVLEWNDEVDTAFLQQLDADHEVIDYCVYSIPCANTFSITTVTLGQINTDVA